MNAMTALIDRVQENGQDFEFYPTTDEIIDALVRDLKRWDPHHNSYRSVLDIGAGSGKVLLALRDRAEFKDLHAMEKSQVLCEQLPPEILVVGTDFAEQSLLSKHVDVVFCNPPYSEFEEWAVKIIKQSASQVIYLVIPERWEVSTKIKDALKFRDAKCAKVGKFDFHDAERAARAKVHLLRVDLNRERYRHNKEDDDAFERFFNEEFAHLVGKFDKSVKTEEEEKKSRFTDLVVGPSYIESLVSLYYAEMANVQRNFDLVGKLDANLLREFNITPATVMACLKTRMAGLRSDYWNELFGHLDTVTNRLTSASRKRLLEVLHRHVHVDFTESNIYAVVTWVIKNANRYIESQLIDTYELMVDKCNVVMYKSNQRTWQDAGWRYNRESDPNSHFALDYRIVTHRLGGMQTGYSYTELSEPAGEFLGDLLTLARNLGFTCDTAVHRLGHSGRRDWKGGECYQFYARWRGKEILLYDVRAYKNRNLHLRLAKAFILALNVEHGRLKGWLHTREQAAEELKDPKAAEFFRANKLITSSAATLLLPGPI